MFWKRPNASRPIPGSSRPVKRAPNEAHKQQFRIGISHIHPLWVKPKKVEISL